MTEIVFRIMELVVMLAVLGYLAAVKKINENDKAQAAFDNIQMWADIVVRWAADRLDCQPGEDRREAAVTALKQVRDKLGIELTDEQVAMLVSSAYQVIMEDTLLLDGIEIIEDEA